MELDFLNLSIEVKEVAEDGTFEGIASQYGVEDLGGDIIDGGAFKKTLAENQIVPILWQHNGHEVIGEGQVKEWQGKLRISGKLDLDDPVAQKAYGKLKKRLIKGLSIGYTAIHTMWEEIEGKFIRHITELKLWEVSVVTFPMLPSAQVTRVKSARDGSEYLDITRAWLEAERKSPTLDPTRRADLRAVMEKGLALLSDKVTPEPEAVDAPKPSEADAAKGAAVKGDEPVVDHSALKALLQKRTQLWNS